MSILPEARLFIDGTLRRAAGDRTYDVIGPWTGKPVGKAADASAADVEEAIAAARRAFDRTDWPTDHAGRYRRRSAAHAIAPFALSSIRPIRGPATTPERYRAFTGWRDTDAHLSFAIVVPAVRR